jgi:hypothetical protein
MTHLEKINSLNPETDAWEILKLSAMYEFPWDYARSLELALFRTFAVPSISKILHQTKEFGKRPQKRYDDTDLILSEILENGPESERTKEVIRKMNYLHSHYPISNNDYVYVLSTFVLEPPRWIDKRGYRQVTRNEKLAYYHSWLLIGNEMGIKNIPASLEELEQFNAAYEQENFVFNATNSAVGISTENMLLGWVLPKFLFPAAKPFLHAVMDERLLNAMGFSKPGFFVQKFTDAFFTARKNMIRFLPQRNHPVLRTKISRKQTYPHGYKIEELGSIPYRDKKL